MTNWLTDHTAKRDALIAAHAYDPAFEHTNCGVGLVASIDGSPRRDVVERSIRALKNVWHRGAVDADGKTGDGAGIRLDIPQEFFRAQIEKTGHKPTAAKTAVGMIFLPRTDFAAQERARSIVESELLKEGFYIYGWRQVPIDIRVIGDKAKATRPAIEQVLFRDPKGRKGDKLERVLYVVRRRIEKRVVFDAIQDFYICSLSVQTVIYKGMFLAEDIDNFYPDLKDERFVSRAAIYHQRYSTNTFPTWRLAQPFRMLAHNGEINTLKANVNHMKSHEIKMAANVFGEDAEDVKPIVQKGSSDSAALDAVFELLVRAGRSAPLAKVLLVPEAYSKRGDLMPESWRALYEYSNAVMEPWDGPAALCAYDGHWVMAGLDRNGLRPLRYAISEDGLLAVGSEAGMCPMVEAEIVQKGSVKPGRMIAVDLDGGQFYRSREILDKLASAKPYKRWLEKSVNLDEKLAGPEPAPMLSGEALVRRQLSCGQTLEDLELVLTPMAEKAKEAIGSMGDDTPLAVLSDIYRPLSHYFRQNFSQVTNPPIDPLRETRVMGLKTRFRNLRNILAQSEGQTRAMYVLESPVMTTGMTERFLDMEAERVRTIDCTFERPLDGTGQGRALRDALRRIRSEVEDAVNAGQETLVLSDMNVSDTRASAPMILCVGAAHSHLVEAGLRSSCSLIVRSAECLDTHYFAVLIGAGATAVNAWMAQDSLADRCNRGLLDMDADTAVARYKTAIEQGLLKIISKMGISVISSYRGGNNFEALGLSRSLVLRNFPGVTSRISGIGLSGLERKLLDAHEAAFDPAVVRLPVGGLYRVRARGERHAYQADMIHMLQEAVTREDYQLYRRYADTVNAGAPIQIRDLLDVQSAEQRSAPHTDLRNVQSVNEIRRRFVTPGMSLGSLSPEAHGTLSIAMNRIGAKSVSGEGGEDRARYQRLPNGDNPNSAVKQIASGRFGVTAEYLNQCREIEIKVAQGAKPGEGGQLPGFKVTEFIAKLRNSTPGVTLISPPPHHDIYSIEDLAQLIHDLKRSNPVADVSVKLVAEVGVGTVAAGVAKAKADHILISGADGGTGASPLTSIKHCGLPWELGLAEAHQTLVLNGLRSRVSLETDGGFKTGRDVIIAACLGAEEFGFSTAPMITMGCIMMRKCHLNTCPVGVCTQDPDLRAKFNGTPEHVLNYLFMVAEEARGYMARMGVRTIEQLVGRVELLRTRAAVDAWKAHGLDLSALLLPAKSPSPDAKAFKCEGQDHGLESHLDNRLIAEAMPALEDKKPVRIELPVTNLNRTVGTMLSWELSKRHGADGLEPHTIDARLRGSAGQSLGAWLARGVSLTVTGDANDYVGKGLSGGRIVVKPPSSSGFKAEENVIIGNVALYGATSGEAYFRGVAAERFCVRNSGASAVVEGVGDHGCEYMTGGRAVILGGVGRNFAAGMSGGIAYVLDPDDTLLQSCNLGMVELEKVTDPEDAEELQNLIVEHARLTDSPVADRVLRDWDRSLKRFKKVMPIDYRRVLERQKRATAVESQPGALELGLG